MQGRDSSPTSNHWEDSEAAVALLRDYRAQASAQGVDRHLAEATDASPVLRALLEADEPARIAAGYGHTLREIAQQPFVWADTALRAIEFLRAEIRPLLHSGAIQSVVIAGSGSSHYVGELVAPALNSRLGIPVAAVPAGDFLTHGRAALPLPGPALFVSIARSGNSPESLTAARIMASEAPGSRFLHITCNAEGRLARPSGDDPPAHLLVLHPLSNDRSLVMTSSFTSLALAALALGYFDAPVEYLTQAARLCESTAATLAPVLGFSADLPFGDCRRAAYLGSGCQFGAAREAALKLTEMTAGGIVAMAETHLGLRHGPMAAIHPDTLVVSLLPPAFRPARYASDLVSELSIKELGLAIVVAVAGDLPRLAASGIGTPATPEASPQASGIAEPFAAIENVVLGQAIGFHACRKRGLRPDAPSDTDVITRVVPPFPIYDPDCETGLRGELRRLVR